MAEIVNVKVGDAPYDVVVEPGLLARVGGDLVSRLGCRGVGVVLDRSIETSVWPVVEASFPPRFSFYRYVLPSGEGNKSLDRVREAYDVFLNARIDRGTPIIALGGGGTGDLAGFVAATVLRGVPLVQIPTTLLAMVDSSVGGKVGVNHGSFKNMVGAFKQPEVVYCDPTVLRSLPQREFCNGLAECIKHAIIRDAPLLAELEENLPRLLDRDIDYLTTFIGRNVATKARVVQSDVFERGERAHLNLGHTFGHAIETVSQHEYAHGEAVSLGICAAAHVAARLGALDEADRRRIVALLGRAGLPTTGLDLDETVLYSAMLHDKKASGGGLKIVIPQGLGAATVREDVSRDLILEAINSLRSE